MNPVFSEIETTAKKIGRIAQRVGMPIGVTIHLAASDWFEWFAAVRAMTTLDPMEISHEDYAAGRMRFRFRGVIYEGINDPQGMQHVILPGLDKTA